MNILSTPTDGGGKFPINRNYKIVILGDVGVGKSSLILWRKRKETETTITKIRSLYKSVSSNDNQLISDDSKVSFSYIEMEGDNFELVKECQGIMICFDLNDDSYISGERIPFDYSVGRYLVKLIELLGKKKVKEFPILLVGTKDDSPNKLDFKKIEDIITLFINSGMNLISYQYDKFIGLEICGHWNAGTKGHLRDKKNRWISTSAKTGHNVHLAFEIIEHSVEEQSIFNLSIKETISQTVNEPVVSPQPLTIDVNKLSKLIATIHQPDKTLFDNLLIFAKPAMNRIYSNLTDEVFSGIEEDISSYLTNWLLMAVKAPFGITDFTIRFSNGFYALTFFLGSFIIVVFTDEKSLERTVLNIEAIQKELNDVL